MSLLQSNPLHPNGEWIEMRTNWTALQTFLETTRHKASIELSLRYGVAAPIEIVILTVAVGLLFLCCCICFTFQTTMACIRHRRMLRNQQVIRLADEPHDDEEEHEQVAREETRAAAPGDSSDDDLASSPRKSAERV
tara:strand:+ start:153 stop:563 length:411 start_codon:yes stop_codon:yes gene_type:complete